MKKKTEEDTKSELSREEIEDLYRAFSELEQGKVDIVKTREELERLLKSLKEGEQNDE